MTPGLVMALLKRGGLALLMVVALGWWAAHLDEVTRAERRALEVDFKAERKDDREAFERALRAVAERAAASCAQECQRLMRAPAPRASRIDTE